MSAQRSKQQTSLGFYRKRQTIKCLMQERPQSILTVQKCVKTAIHDVQKSIKEFENEFYDKKTAEEDIRSILPSTKLLMKTLKVYYIHASWQIKDMKYQVEYSPGDQYKAELMDAINALYDYHYKILKMVPEKIKILIEDVNDILEIMQRYCISFYDDDDDGYLETVKHYCNQQKEYLKIVNIHLKNIVSMGEAYRSEDGLKVAYFGLNTNELARLCDACNLPILLIVPEAFQNLKNSCQALKKWLQDDIHYVSFLHNDADELRSRKLILFSSLKKLQQKSVHQYKKISISKKEIQTIEQELMKLQDKEKIYSKQINKLSKDVKFLTMDIEVTQNQKQILQKKHDNEAMNSSNQEVNELLSNIIQLRLICSDKQVKIEQLQGKKSFITEKQQKIVLKEKEIKDIDEDTQILKKEIVEKENEIKRVETCLNKIKLIIMHRTSSGITKKIFRNVTMNMNSRNFNKEQTQNHGYHDLNQAINLVSEKIDKDWIKLYQNMKFDPSRGNDQVDEDINSIIADKYRANSKILAKEALNKWTRLNYHPVVEDLIAVLISINRGDIAQEVKKILRNRRLKLEKSHTSIELSSDNNYVDDAVNIFMSRKGPFRKFHSQNQEADDDYLSDGTFSDFE